MCPGHILKTKSASIHYIILCTLQSNCREVKLKLTTKTKASHSLYIQHEMTLHTSRGQCFKKETAKKGHPADDCTNHLSVRVYYKVIITKYRYRQSAS